MLHKITLEGYEALLEAGPACGGALSLGTAGSYGVEKLFITVADDWQGLSIRASFQPAGVRVLLSPGQAVDVPWEATQAPLPYPKGRIVFQGFSGEKLVNTCDLPYSVAAHSAAGELAPQPPTPDEYEKFVQQVQADADRAEAAAKDAGAFAGQAAASAAAAESSETAAAASAQAAKGSESTSAASAGAAKTSEDAAAASAAEAAASAAAAKQSQRAAASSATQAEQAAQRAEDAADKTAEFVDATFRCLLDGKNTTEVFWSWWPLSAGDGVTKYQRLERFAKMLAESARGKTYTVRFYNDNVSGDYTGTPLDDLADGREAAPLLTDASPETADWSEEDPFTWYIRANALSLEDGTMNVLAVEGESDFDLSGETAPVYCFALSLTLKEWEDSEHLYNSFRTLEGSGYEPMAGDVAPDKSRRWLTWHPAFLGGKNSKGGMTSGADLPPMPWTSANEAIPLARKITAYDALWTDCDQQYVLAQWRIRHWTLSNSDKLEGCTAYNYQYTLAAAETGVKRVLVTKAQGANFIVGSAVCLGERGANTSVDRNYAYSHDILSWAEISGITNVTVNGTEYAALNLLIDTPIDTTTTMLVSTMPWKSGTTEVVQGHSDGCRGNLTNGKYPYRVAGIEMQIGTYTEQLDPLWKVSIVDDHWRYDVFSCRSGEKQVGSISGDYEQIGSFDLNDKANWTWCYIRKLGKLGAEAMMYDKFGGSGSTYVRAAFYSPGSAGLYAPWRGGNLNDGSNCGLPCANGNNGPGTSNWNGVPRHADDK